MPVNRPGRRLTARGTLRAAGAAALGLAAAMSAQSLRAQGPTLDDVMKRAGVYVVEFKRQLSGIVAEETYQQQVKLENGHTVSFRNVRRLKSDLLLIRPTGTPQYVEYRDVFEVDGVELRDRGERLTALLQDRSADASAQVGRIISESSRYNIGKVVRTVNTPLMTLQFLEPASQPRFRFRRASKTAASVDEPRGAREGEPSVFRVATEMWTVEYSERERPTIIRRPTGGNLPARGRFWINPDTGAVLMSELVTEGSDVAATITVSYQSEPLMGFLVPVEMRERYVGLRDHIEGHAVYGKFRPVSVAAQH